MRLVDAAGMVRLTTTRSIDLNGDRVIDPFTESGLYFFFGVPAGQYEIRHELPLGWIRTEPAGGYSLDLGPAQGELGLDIGLKPVMIAGQVVRDLDRDGRFDATDAGLDGVVVELWKASSTTRVGRQFTAGMDLNGDGQIDPFTEAGRYRFDHLLPGDYELRLKVGDDWLPLQYPMVAVTDVEALIEPIDFLVMEALPLDLAEVTADDDEATLGIALPGAGFLPLPSAWTPVAHTGAYNDDFYVNATPYSAAVFDVAVPESGVYDVSLWWPDLWGFVWPEVTLGVTVTDDNGDHQFAVHQRPTLGGSPDVDRWYSLPDSFTVTSGSIRIMFDANGAEAGHILLDAVRVTEHWIDGFLSGRVFDDASADGVKGAEELGLDGWLVELVDAASGEVLATQLTQSVDLDGDGSIDPITESGLYDFLVLPAADYEIRAFAQAGWDWTSPVGGTHTVALTTFDPDQADLDFGAMLAGGGVAGALGDPIDLLAELEPVL